ncbi:MAG: acyltransferase [Pseudomonadota bacterium]
MAWSDRDVFTAIDRVRCAFRSLAYRAACAVFSRHIVIGRNVRFLGPIRATHLAKAHVRVGDACLFSSAQITALPGARLDIGPRCSFNAGLVLAAREHISIGEDAMVGEYTSIRDFTHDHGAAAGAKHGGYRGGPTTIGARVWLGRGVCVMPGVTIGAGAVVGANAVVTRDVPAGAIVGGVPARMLGCAIQAGKS